MAGWPSHPLYSARRREDLPQHCRRHPSGEAADDQSTAVATAWRDALQFPGTLGKCAGGSESNQKSWSDFSGLMGPGCFRFRSASVRAEIAGFVVLILRHFWALLSRCSLRVVCGRPVRASDYWHQGLASYESQGQSVLHHRRPSRSSEAPRSCALVAPRHATRRRVPAHLPPRTSQDR